MPFQHQMQANRFELKYIVDEPTARGCRDFSRSYLTPDEHADVKNNYSYPIHSLYLDSPDHSLARGTMDGHKNRFKLRIRYYDDNPKSPVFFEIKRRVNDAILKERAPVRLASFNELLDGRWPQTTDLMNPANPKHFMALRNFCDLARQSNSRGRAIVSYIREAWVTPDNDAVRVTFDRQLVATPFAGKLVCADFENGLKPEIAGVVLELKFTDRFPRWMREMVRIFGLRRTSMPKYVHCLHTLQGFEAMARRPDIYKPLVLTLPMKAGMKSQLGLSV